MVNNEPINVVPYSGTDVQPGPTWSGLLLSLLQLKLLTNRELTPFGSGTGFSKRIDLDDAYMVRATVFSRLATLRVVCLLKLNRHVAGISLNLDLLRRLTIDCDPGVWGESRSRYGTIDGLEFCAAKLDPIALILFIRFSRGVVVPTQLVLVDFDVN